MKLVLINLTENIPNCLFLTINVAANSSLLALGLLLGIGNRRRSSPYLLPMYQIAYWSNAGLLLTDPRVDGSNRVRLNQNKPCQ